MINVPKVQMLPNGPSFSKLVQGYWRLAEWDLRPQECLSFIEDHLELGITTVDHAHVYGSPSCERLFGKALSLDPSLRDQMEIISKCGIELPAEGRITHYNSSKDSIIYSVELSLSRLGVDHLDALLIHRPDYLMDADVVAEAFQQLKQEGKVKHFGVSNFNSAQFSLLQSRLDEPLITNQIEINPLNLDSLHNGILEKLQELRVTPMAWSCLGGGELFNDELEKSQRLIYELTKIAKELEVDSIDQVIYAWVMRHPSNPIPILGTGDIDRIKNAVNSLQLTMNHEQWYRILAASRNHGVV
ncbi:aldo/keto reductase [Akkermansiaceae bacterium]|nr:aldo/keto reductase [Akkermansiaceae bacterium]